MLIDKKNNSILSLFFLNETNKGHFFCVTLFWLAKVKDDLHFEKFCMQKSVFVHCTGNMYKWRCRMSLFAIWSTELHEQCFSLKSWKLQLESLYMYPFYICISEVSTAGVNFSDLLFSADTFVDERSFQNLHQHFLEYCKEAFIRAYIYNFILLTFYNKLTWSKLL